MYSLSAVISAEDFTLTSVFNFIQMPQLTTSLTFLTVNDVEAKTVIHNNMNIPSVNGDLTQQMKAKIPERVDFFFSITF